MDDEHRSGDFGKLRSSEYCSRNDGIDSHDPDSFTLENREEKRISSIGLAREGKGNKDPQKEHRPIA